MTGDISGKTLTVTINGVTIAGPSGWDATVEFDKLDGTVGTDGGYRSTKPGVVGVSGTIRFKVNVLAGLVISGGSVANLNLYYRNGDLQPAVAMPVATIFNVRKSGDVRGMFTVEANFESDGAFTVNL